MAALFVLTKAAGAAAWSLATPMPVDAATARQAVDVELGKTPTARVLVVNVVRSFRAQTTTAEDADPVAGL